MNEKKLEALMIKLNNNLEAVRSALEEHEHMSDGAAVSRTCVHSEFERSYEYIRDGDLREVFHEDKD